MRSGDPERGRLSAAGAPQVIAAADPQHLRQAAAAADRALAQLDTLAAAQRRPQGVLPVAKRHAPSGAGAAAGAVPKDANAAQRTARAIRARDIEALTAARAVAGGRAVSPPREAGLQALATAAASLASTAPAPAAHGQTAPPSPGPAREAGPAHGARAAWDDADASLAETEGGAGRARCGAVLGEPLQIGDCIRAALRGGSHATVRQLALMTPASPARKVLVDAVRASGDPRASDALYTLVEAELLLGLATPSRATAEGATP